MQHVPSWVKISMKIYRVRWHSWCINALAYHWLAQGWMSHMISHSEHKDCIGQQLIIERFNVRVKLIEIPSLNQPVSLSGWRLYSQPVNGTPLLRLFQAAISNRKEWAKAYTHHRWQWRWAVRFCSCKVFKIGIRSEERKLGVCRTVPIRYISLPPVNHKHSH